MIEAARELRSSGSIVPLLDRMWTFEEFLALVDSLEGALPLARASDLSDEPLARRIFQLSEGLIGEVVAKRLGLL